MLCFLKRQYHLKALEVKSSHPWDGSSTSNSRLTQGKLELYSGIVAASTLLTHTVLSEGEEAGEKEEKVKDKSPTEVCHLFHSF